MMKSDKWLNWDSPGKALITGASAGIGRCFAKQLAQKGFDLVLVARRKDRLESLAAELSSVCGVKCEILAADLADQSEIDYLANRLRCMDNLDILINNAGFGSLGHFADIPLEKSMRMFHLHMTAPVALTSAALPGMLKRKRGAIINVSSVAAFVYTPGNVMYNSTKSFLVAFSESLHLEVKNAGIKIQALCPGFTQTEFHDVGDFKGFDRGLIPQRLWMTADAVVYLSLQALEEDREAACIPGWRNRLCVWLFAHSALFRKIMQREVEAGAKETKAR